MDEGTKLLAGSCWILGYIAAMSVEGPLYLYTGKSFCSIVDYLNSLAFLQNWYGGLGIAFMRAVYIQNSSIFLMREKQVVFLIAITSLTTTHGLIFLWWFIIYSPTYPDFKPICLGRPMDDPLLHYESLNTISGTNYYIVLSILTFLTSSILLLEMTLYFSIFKFLFAHDKVARVRLALSDSTIKKRMKRNAIDLFGHAFIFFLDGCWLIIKVIEAWSAKGSSPALLRHRRWIFKSIFMCMYGILSIIHIGFSSTLRADMIAIFKPYFCFIVWIWNTLRKRSQ